MWTIRVGPTMLLALLVACAPPTLNAGAPSPTESTNEPTPTVAVEKRVVVTPVPQPCPGGYALNESAKASVSFRERLDLIVQPEHIGMLETSLAQWNGGAEVSRPVSGGFAFKEGGRFDACSAIVVNLRTLRSVDDPFINIAGGPQLDHRDHTVHDVVLETDRWPQATFRPRTYTGAPTPLPSQGGWEITVTGDLTLRDQTHETVWRGTARSTPGRLEVVLTCDVPWVQFGLDLPQPPYVLKYDDHATLAILIIATL